MRHAPRALLAAGLGFAVALLVACGGGSGLLSSDQANTLNSQLDSVSAAVGAGQCGAAGTAASSFANAVANLPPSVSSTLISNLNQGASTIQRLAAQDCTHTSTTSSTTSSSSTTTSSHTSTPTSTSTSTTTQVPTSTSTATQPTTTGSTTTGSGSGGAGTGGGGGSGGAGLGNGNGQ